MVLLAAVTGCGRRGFDSLEPPESVDVAPVYAMHGEWNEWITNNNGGTDRWNQPDVACPASRAGTHDTCIHGGELRAFTVTTRASCAGLVAADDVGAFDWICDDSSGSVVFRSVALRDGARLAMLLDPTGTAWLPIGVSVSEGGTVVARHAPSVWWTNPVRAMPANPTSGLVVIDGTDDDGPGPDEAFAAGTILTVASDAQSDGYNLALDRLSVVVMPGARLHLAAGAAANCNATTGKPTPVTLDPFTYRPCLIAAGDRAFLWLEGAFDNAPGMAGANNTAIVLATSDRGTIRNVTTQNGEYGMLLVSGHGNFLYDVRMMAHANYGVIVEGSRENVIARLFVGNTTAGVTGGYTGLLLDNGTTDTAVSQVVVTGGSQFGLLLFAPGNDRNAVTHVTIANTGHGIQTLETTNDLSVWQLVDASSGEDGMHIGGIDGGRFAQLALVDAADDGIEDDGVTNTSFGGSILFGGNGLDCETCPSLAPANVVTGVDVSTAFVGRIATAPHSTIDDWTDVASPYQAWGIDAAYGSAAARDHCASGTCALWDWRLTPSSPLRDRSGNGVTLNEPFVAGAPCPAAAAGDRSLTTAGGRSYLMNATEIFFDGRGNENGLCESGEACRYSPNFGAYQGEGDELGEPCVFADGVIAGVTLYAYPTE